MSQAQPRELVAIQRDYTQFCQQAGDLQYKIFCYQDELSQLNKKLIQLNQEANALKKDTNGRSESSETSNETGYTDSKNSENSVAASAN